MTTQARSTAKDYLANYDGPKIDMPTIFGTPVIKQIYKRDSQIFARNALFVTFFARIAFDDNTVDPLEEALVDKIAKMSKKFDDKIQQAQALMRDNDLDEDDMCQNNLPVTFDVVVTSPLFKKFVGLMKKADELINYYDTLWMNGQVKSSIYNEMRFEVKRDIRGVVSFVRNTWIGLQKRVQHDRVSKLNAAIGDAADVGQGDASDKADDADSGAAEPKVASKRKVAGDKAAPVQAELQHVEPAVAAG